MLRPIKVSDLPLKIRVTLRDGLPISYHGFDSATIRGLYVIGLSGGGTEIVAGPPALDDISGTDRLKWVTRLEGYRDDLKGFHFYTATHMDDLINKLIVTANSPQINYSVSNLSGLVGAAALYLPSTSTLSFPGSVADTAMNQIIHETIHAYDHHHGAGGNESFYLRSAGSGLLFQPKLEQAEALAQTTCHLLNQFVDQMRAVEKEIDAYNGSDYGIRIAWKNLVTNLARVGSVNFDGQIEWKTALGTQRRKVTGADIQDVADKLGYQIDMSALMPKLQQAIAAKGSNYKLPRSVQDGTTTFSIPNIFW